MTRVEILFHFVFFAGSFFLSSALEETPNHDFRAEQNIPNPCTFHDIYIIQNETIISNSSKPIATRQSVEDFYNYNRVTKSFDGSDAIKRYWDGDLSLIGIHQSKLTCELSLVIVNSKPWSGGLKQFIHMYVTGDLWDPLVQDDPSFISFMLFDDKYDSIYQRQRNMTGFEWIWGKEDTDGVAHPVVNSSWTGCIEVFGEWGDTDPYLGFGGPSRWKFVSGGVGDDTSTVDLSTDSRLHICVGVLPTNLTDSALGQFALDSDPFPEVCDEEIRYNICGYCTRPVCHWHWFCNIYRFWNCYLGHDVDPFDLPIAFG